MPKYIPDTQQRDGPDELHEKILQKLVIHDRLVRCKNEHDGEKLAVTVKNKQNCKIWVTDKAEAQFKVTLDCCNAIASVFLLIVCTLNSWRRYV